MALVLPMPGPGAGSAQASLLCRAVASLGIRDMPEFQGGKACDFCLFHFLSSRSKLEVLSLKLLEKRLLDTNLLWRQLSIFLSE